MFHNIQISIAFYLKGTQDPGLDGTLRQNNLMGPYVQCPVL